MSGFHVVAGADDTFERPAIRRLTLSDLKAALRLGLDDFFEKPSHTVFLCLIYPVAGLVLSAWMTGANILTLLFPLMSGFALVGPVAAIGLYEISRRREAGLDTSWWHALDVRRSPALPSIIGVAVWLLAVFVAWLLTAQAIYGAHFGDTQPQGLGEMAQMMLASEAGRSVMLWGNLAGFGFAVLVLATSVVAFPLLLDRDAGALAALDTSLRVTLANPVPVAVWGLIVAGLLVIGTVPFFAGLAVVLPVLGHSTWHLYRRAVAEAG